ncbi:zygotic DNA replication licensing factor mcm3-like [Lytechinus variegatus]|uniref:zygotic DNA replication licensing factor mcm3-like n=1 Tax=Lytechinus variegatus TaxID=7654 RepID=UPI001BB23CFF|nr:zygotic DNA replication licensing factor mcm3-like [Lytechinus variegatus]
MDTDIDQQLRDYQREYLEFLDDDADQGIYHEKVQSMISKNQCRLIVNINDLRRKYPKRASRLLNEAHEEVACLQRALKEFVTSADTAYGKQHDDFFVGFEGSFGAKHVTPRTLAASYLGNLVCVEGIVTKCSLVRPKVVRSVHYCPATRKTMERKYTDLTSLDAFPSSSVYPTKDDQGNPLETEFGLSMYKDHQTITIQEMPEKAPAGQLPRSVDIIVDNDLVDVCKPGDRVQIIGTFRCLPNKQGSYTNGTFRTIIIANHVQLLSKETVPNFTAEDIAKIRKFSQDKKEDVFELLAKSLAPSIHGHEYIKKAVLCMLLGGMEKVLENGTRLRGDINVLLIGDPSTAKSQMLRYVLHTAPRAIPTTGRGSSGVGLTAAVTTDQETGERRLEAGAMVLADRGVVCIDEFDKMSDQDRTAIHEVMEQGRVTIAKAGIHAKLNARCSVLAAANPVYGRYDQYKTPMENIGLQDSLLSRFDVIFIVLDQMDPEHDRKISDHVLRMHRYRQSGEQDGDAMPLGSSVEFLATNDPDAIEEEKQETKVFDKHDKLLHGARKKQKYVSMEFMRKYIHIAKGMQPQLTREAADCIADEYSKLRSQDATANNIAKTAPVTARSLETLIRLSTAHAKARMSKTVDLQDAEAAIQLVQFAIFKKVLEKKRKRPQEGDSGSEDDEEAKKEKKQRRKKKGAQRKERPAGAEGEEDPYDFDSYEESGDDEVMPTPRKRPSLSQDSSQTQPMDTDDSQDTQTTIDPQRLKLFKSTVHKTFEATHAQSIPMTQISEALTTEHKEAPFSKAEIDSALSKMQDDNQIMVSEGIVFLI